MSINSIKSEICQLLGLTAITASEAKQLTQASSISGNWSKTETWQALLDVIKDELRLEQSTTDVSPVNNESITEQIQQVTEHPSPITVNPVVSADSFIDLILANKVWFYTQYKITEIKFPSNNKALLYSDLLQDIFVITKTSNYEIAFKSVNQVMEDVRELFSFDWLKLANYYHDLKENNLVSDKGKTVYKSVALPREVSPGNQLILNVANFRQQNTGDKSSKNIKTFKDWLRVMYLELPEGRVEAFLAGLTRNYSRQAIQEVREAFTGYDKITGKLLNNNARTGSMAFYSDPHLDIKGRFADKKAVYLTRAEERYTPTTDIYSQIKISELFKLLDIEVDMSNYTKYVSFCGYWKLVIISHILDRPQFSVTDDWMRYVIGGLRLNGDTFGAYVLVEEIDSKGLNNKIRMTNDTLFKLAADSSGKKPSKFMEASKMKVIERIEVKHSNMLQSHGRPKSVKNTNKGGKGANYIKLAETHSYELRLFYLEGSSKQPPHHSFKEVLANVVFVEKQTSISNEIGQIWIKETRNNSRTLTFHSPKVNKFNSGLMTGNLKRKILTNKNHIERLSEKIRQLRKEREDGKVRQFHLVNERVITDEKGLAVSIRTEDDIAKELRGLIDEKLRYELEITAYDMGLPHEIVLALQQLGIGLTTGGIIEPRQLDWTRIFTTLELQIPLIKNNPIIVKGVKHES